MKVLAIGAHFDDIELACGGSMLAWRDKGHSLTVFVATRSGYRDEKGGIVRSDKVARTEGRASAKRMEATLIEGRFAVFNLEFSEPLNRKVVSIVNCTQPDLILVPWHGDVHRDHRELSLSCLHCCRHVPRVLMYCSNWHEGSSRFDPRFFVDISPTLEGKGELIRLFDSENSRTGGRWIDFVYSQARLFGLKAGVQFAEGFEVVRWRL